MKEIKIIAFDADDTLWTNEVYFRETEEILCELLSPYMEKEMIIPQLYHTEMQNMRLYGYGVKAFILSVIETSLRVTSGQIPVSVIGQIIELGKEQLSKPVELLDGAEDTLNALVGKYRLILATKGDLLDQERKLRESGLEHLFHHVEIMSNKNEGSYRKLLNHLDCLPEDFLMVGNSLRSDILPPLSLGSYAIHVPYHITWEHERVNEPIINDKFHTVDSLREIVSLLP